MQVKTTIYYNVKKFILNNSTNICKVIQYYKSEPASAQDAADADSLWKYCITWQVFHRRPWNFPCLSRGMLPKEAANIAWKFQILVKLFKINSWRYNKWWFWLAFWNSRMKHLITSEIFYVGQWNFLICVEDTWLIALKILME